MFKTNMTLGLAVLTLAGCATMLPVVAGREQKMTKAGFQREAVTTQAQQAMVKSLTAYVITSVPDGAGKKYVYYDPANCKCIYVGNEQAWNHFQQDKQEFSFATRETNATPLMSKTPWSWEPWQD